jgi:membrane protein implicated in regulation of membrane protease activity
MQWLFLVLGLLAALAELHATTFYLSAVAIAGISTAVAGIWVAPAYLPLLFVAICIALLPAVMLLRRRLSTSRTLPDPDVGQTVTVVEVAPDARHLFVSYRGSRWEAVMDSGPPPLPGDVAVITARTDKLLHLTDPALPGTAP